MQSIRRTKRAATLVEHLASQLPTLEQPTIAAYGDDQPGKAKTNKTHRSLISGSRMKPEISGPRIQPRTLTA